MGCLYSILFFKKLFSLKNTSKLIPSSEVESDQPEAEYKTELDIDLSLDGYKHIRKYYVK